MERVITIKGSIDSMSRAEGMISAKLRQSYESDLQAMAVRDDHPSQHHGHADWSSSSGVVMSYNTVNF